MTSMFASSIVGNASPPHHTSDVRVSGFNSLHLWLLAHGLWRTTAFCDMWSHSPRQHYTPHYMLSKLSTTLHPRTCVTERHRAIARPSGPSGISHNHG
eukprot:35149-Eustigmatos_ZCMA.PRE.1